MQHGDHSRNIFSQFVFLSSIGEEGVRISQQLDKDMGMAGCQQHCLFLSNWPHFRRACCAQTSWHEHKCELVGNNCATQNLDKPQAGRNGAGNGGVGQAGQNEAAWEGARPSDVQRGRAELGRRRRGRAGVADLGRVTTFGEGKTFHFDAQHGNQLFWRVPGSKTRGNVITTAWRKGDFMPHSSSTKRI